MIQHHCSTPNQRAYWVSELIAHEGSYGGVGQMSRDHGVSRQSLYTWKAKGQDALQAVFAPKEQARAAEPELERAVLTLLGEAHTSYRGMHTCLESLLGLHVSLGTIVSIVQVAGQRAQQWLSQQKSSGEGAVALDEQYGSKRGEAYLTVVDVHSSLVWASVPPVAVDGESWHLV
jgi:transposase-like protein